MANLSYANALSLTEVRQRNLKLEDKLKKKRRFGSLAQKWAY
jgi:hypothetical protein